MSHKAKALKQQADDKYKLRLFKEAAGLYLQAESASPKEAVYPSNLSAAYFELGSYATCFRAICRANSKLSEEDLNGTLFLRLSMRCAKALSHGARVGSISLELLGEEQSVQTVRRLESATEKSGASEELIAAWKEWKRVEREMIAMCEGRQDAEIRLANLRVTKCTMDSDLEYYTIGHDAPMSIVDDWGPDKDDADPIHLKSMSNEELSRLSFLFGGIGDARHAYGSIIGLGKAYMKLNRRKASKIQAHFTLLDCQSTALARDLSIFLMLDQLSQHNGPAKERLEIVATIFYVFIGVLMPPYCHERLTKFLLRLGYLGCADSSCFWFAVSSQVHASHSEAIPGILNSLNHWNTALNEKTVRGLLEHQNGNRTLVSRQTEEYLSRVASTPIHDTFEYDKQVRTVESWTEDRLLEYAEVMVGPCPHHARNDPIKRKEWLQKVRPMAIEALRRSSPDRRPEDYLANDPFELESKWYSKMRVFLPPPILRSADEGFEEPWKVAQEPCGKWSNPITQSSAEKARAYIINAWKPNPAFFDPIQERGFGYPDMNVKVFDIIEVLAEAAERFDLLRHPNKDCPAFSAAEAFFTGVAEGLKTLKGHLKIEFLRSDLLQGVRKMRVFADTNRPVEFPRTYTRMWLSNTTDYTHAFLTAGIYCTPNLELHPRAGASFNCLFNPILWKNHDEYCYGYTLLMSEDYNRFLGYSNDQVAIWARSAVKPLPLPRVLSDLASHEELIAWLTRLLFSIITPGTISTANLERFYYPINLVVFVDLLKHLVKVGFPPHWLSRFFASILSNTLVTDVPPYLGRLPIPSSERHRVVPKRKVDLRPWYPDLESILAIGYESIPFPFSLPATFATSADEIGTYTVDVPSYLLRDIAFHPDNNVVSLLFCKGYGDADYFAANMHEVLEGKLGSARAVEVVTMVDSVSLFTDRIIQWKMGKERVKRMQEERWVMAPYRFDLRKPRKYLFFFKEIN
ncbi:hypothetical protein BXZ70DRAFT_1007652 [Cristinia sonorae]|uniref:DUF4470 domain-containing protein n=1 Tax=Cristinia sonorae TaxID=1940300 RepID=A0A8K0UQX3_9AGAR|nr:hypothetical protein BXZ70DRAFT_1007652 [Cristinia sonorae]